MTPRVTTRLWVDAYLTRLRLADIPAFVVSHGDDTGGAVLVKLNTLDGSCVLFQRGWDLSTGMQKWVELSSGPEKDVDLTVQRQQSFDPDLWVIEVEDRQGRHLLDQDGLI